MCRAGNQVLVLERTSTSGGNVVRWNQPPDDANDYADAAQRIVRSINFSGVTLSTQVYALASDGAHLFMVHRTGNPTRRLSVWSISSAAPVSNSIIYNPTNNPSYASELFDGLTFDDSLATDWLGGITFSDGALLLAVRQSTGNDTVVRALTFSTSRTQRWARAESQDLTSQISTENMILANDGQFVFDSTGGLVQYDLPDGTPATATSLAAFRGGAVHRLSQYSWDPAQSNRTGAQAVFVIRRVLYAFNKSSLEVRDLSDETQGFPYRLVDTRTVGLVAPRTLTVVDDVVYWLGSTSGGGKRFWSFGASGDSVPDALKGKAIEEMLDRMAADGVDLSEAVSHGDDVGGHPVVVTNFKSGGISLGYDADSEKWHARSSLRAIGDDPKTWDWLDEGQGVQRVTHSTTWQNRLIHGGYDRDGKGVLAFASNDDWKDIDGGLVTRVRQFNGGEAERRRVRFPALRVDAVYDQPMVDGEEPYFDLMISNDGGKTFGVPRRRRIGGRTRKPPQPFYRLGISQQRVYRVETSSPVPLVLLGAFFDSSQRVSRKI